MLIVLTAGRSGGGGPSLLRVFFPILIDGAGKPKGGACRGRGGPADTAARPPACQPGTPAHARARTLSLAAPRRRRRSHGPPGLPVTRRGRGGAPHAGAASCLPGLVRGTMSGTRREAAARAGRAPAVSGGGTAAARP